MVVIFLMPGKQEMASADPQMEGENTDLCNSFVWQVMMLGKTHT
jgi:hypothetical protein